MLFLDPDLKIGTINEVFHAPRKIPALRTENILKLNYQLLGTPF